MERDGRLMAHKAPHGSSAQRSTSGAGEAAGHYLKEKNELVRTKEQTMK
jgi:hypothetical protein